MKLGSLAFTFACVSTKARSEKWEGSVRTDVLTPLMEDVGDYEEMKLRCHLLHSAGNSALGVTGGKRDRARDCFRRGRLPGLSLHAPRAETCSR